VGRSVRVLAGVIVALVVGVVSAAPRGAVNAIRTEDLKEWLTYISSDDLQGRAVFTAGFGKETHQ
jgi:hypothetical protein